MRNIFFYLKDLLSAVYVKNYLRYNNITDFLTHDIFSELVIRNIIRLLKKSESRIESCRTLVPTLKCINLYVLLLLCNHFCISNIGYTGSPSAETSGGVYL